MTHWIIFLTFLFLHSVATVCSSVTVSLSTLSIASYCEDSSLVSLDLIPFSWSVCVLFLANSFLTLFFFLSSLLNLILTPDPGLKLALKRKWKVYKLAKNGFYTSCKYISCQFQHPLNLKTNPWPSIFLSWSSYKTNDHIFGCSVKNIHLLTESIQHQSVVSQSVC